MGSLALVTKATAWIVPLSTAKAQCRVTHTLDDALIAGLIADAEEWAQGYTKRMFSEQTWDYYLHEFPSEIQLPVSPVKSITSVTYYDSDNASQTLSSSEYDTDLKSVIPTITSADGYEFPDTYPKPNAVIVRFVAGYVANHPDLATIKAAMLLYVEAHYDREVGNYNNLMAAAERKLDPLRVVSF